MKTKSWKKYTLEKAKNKQLKETNKTQDLKLEI